MPDEQHREGSGEQAGATFWTVNPIWLFAIPTMAVGAFLLWPNPLTIGYRRGTVVSVRDRGRSLDRAAH